MARWTYPRRLILVALGLLLAAAGIPARNDLRWSFDPPVRLPGAVLLAAFVVLETLGVAVLAVLVGMLRRRPRRPPEEPPEAPLFPGGPVVAVLALLAALLVLPLLLVLPTLDRWLGASGGPGTARGTPAVVPAVPSPVPQAGPGAPLVGPGAVLLLGSGAVVLLLGLREVVRRSHRSVSAAAPVADGGGGAADPAEPAREGPLRGVPVDARAAVIGCYAALEETLARASVRRRPADTPEALVRRAEQQRVLRSPAAAGALVELFGRARFSSRPVTLVDVGRARQHLTEACDTADGGP